MTATPVPSPASRRLRPLVAAVGISVTGDGAFFTAAAVLASELTRNALAVSSVSAAMFATWVVFGLPAGALVNRLPLRRVLVAADLVRAALLAILTVVIVLGYPSVILLVVTMVAAGVAQTFADPAGQAMIPAVIGREKADLTDITGKYWSLDKVGRLLVGPPLGSGALALSRPLPFAADAVSFLASAVLVRRLPDVPAPDTSRAPLRAAVGHGIRYVAHSRELRLVVATSGAWNAGFAATIAIFVLWARQVLHIPAGEYGLLIVPAAVAGVATSWRIAPALARRLSYSHLVACGAVIQAACWLTAAATRQTWAAVGGLAVIEVCSSAVNIAVQLTYQQTPREMQTRVMSAARVITWGATGLGALAGGAVAGQFGLVAPFLISAAISLLIALAAWPYRRRLAATRHLTRRRGRAHRMNAATGRGEAG